MKHTALWGRIYFLSVAVEGKKLNV